MATVNKTGTTVTSGVPEAAVPYSGKDRHYVIKNEVDLTGDSITQGDVYQCLAIPEDTLVKSIRIELLTKPTGTALTVDVGDGGDANGWIASFNMVAASAGDWDASQFGTDARAVSADGGYFYSTADTIDVTMTTATAITAGPKFRIYAECVDFN